MQNNADILDFLYAAQLTLSRFVSGMIECYSKEMFFP